MKSYLPRFTCSLVYAFSMLLLSQLNVWGAERPNFVFLISEDNSHHYLDLYFEGGAPTPRIESMARHGVLFENAFSNAPVCSVARTTLITSCYAPRIGTQYHRRSRLAAMPEGLKMFPAYLRDAGYYTTNNSKKDYNAIESAGVWDESSRKANWRGRSADQPFFHKQSFGTSHESSLHFSRESMLRDATETDPATVPVAPYHPDTPTFRYTNARYRDNIRKIDTQIGQVLDRLKADDLLEDTFVFYFGDHGGVLPRGKGYAYESGLHVPLVVRVPENFKHLVDDAMGSRQSGFVSFVDFGPTLLHLAGLEVPGQVDGEPFFGKGITASNVSERDEAFGYADRFDEKWDLVRTLRKGRYEYVRSYQPFNFDGLQNNYRYRMLAFQEWRQLFESGKLNDIQSQFFRTRPAEALYDIQSDPHETVNLANDPKHANVLAELRERLQTRIASMPDLSMLPESVLYDEAMENPVAYGDQQRDRITAALAIADLSLAKWATAEPKLRKALSSDDPLIRYWCIISCSCHGKASSSLAGEIQRIASSDADRLVRVRAAEFLCLTRGDDPRPVIDQALRTASNPVEAGLILNTVVLLRDGPTKVDFDITADSFESLQIDAKADSVKRRLEYLDPPKTTQKSKRSRQKKASGK